MSPSVPSTAALVLVPVLYWLGAAISGQFEPTPGAVSLLCPPPAVLIAVFLRYDGARGWAFVVPCLLAEVAADLPRVSLLEALAIGCANVLEAILTWRLLRAWGFDPHFERMADVGRFVLAGPVVAGLVGAVVGGSAVQLISRPSESLGETVLLWWFGDGLGILIFTPIYLAWAVRRKREPPPLPSRPLVDIGMAVVGLVTLVLLVTARSGQVLGVHLRPQLLLPFVLYASTRLPFRAVCVFVMALAVLFVSLTVNGRPPFAGEDPTYAGIYVQEYVLVMSVLSLGFSALLSNLRLSEEDLRRAYEELHLHAAALKRNNRELQQVAWITSHDLQTPLRAIHSFAQLLQREVGGRLGPTADEWIRRVTENARRLEARLRALGEVAEVGARTAPFVVVDMNATFDAVVAGLEERIRIAGARVTRADLPHVVGDRVQLERAIKELLAHALASEARRIHASSRTEPEDWTFSIHADGAGIPAGQQERIFDLFHASSSGQEAAGAGLALGARVVHWHGGRIWVDSAPGEGTTFRFTIPKQEKLAS